MEQTADEIRHLRGCINDLTSILAIPAMWSGQESAQIVTTLLDAMLGMLRLDFAYARLKDPIGGAPIEMVRLAQTRDLTAQLQEISEVLNGWLGHDLQKWPLLIPDSFAKWLCETDRAIAHQCSLVEQNLNRLLHVEWRALGLLDYQSLERKETRMITDQGGKHFIRAVATQRIQPQLRVVSLAIPLMGVFG